MKGEGGMTMHKPSAVLICGGIGLASVGVAYDGGLFGTTDGHDHSVVFSVAATSTSSFAAGTFTVVSNITGDEVVAPLPSRRPSQQDT
jgi:hypothetical protein